MSLLEARGLVHDYENDVRALDGVDLDVERGELVVVLGPNGAGKSTLLELLGGLLRPTAGAVLLGGAPVARLPRDERARRVAFVPQELRALPDLTVAGFAMGGRYAHFDLWRTPRPEDRAAVARALEQADAAEFESRLLTQLSGGQRQRVLIARALAQESDLLLVDEPTASLDPEHQVRVFSLLAKLTGEGRAAIVASHDLNLASQFATRIVLLRAGSVVASGTVDEVLRPEVLVPVYGPDLAFGSLPSANGDAPRPFVLPWLGGPAE